jgi:Na+/H+-dicarboxylate symporter
MLQEEIKSLKSFTLHIQNLIEKKLWLKVMVAIALGALLGFLLGQNYFDFSKKFTTNLTDWLGLPGQIFMRLVKMIMVPLILASIIRGIVSNSIDQLKKLGIGVFAFFVIFTAIGLTIGTIIALGLNPGGYLDLGEAVSVADNLSQSEEIKTSIPTLITNLLPDNPLESMVSDEMLSVVIFAIITGIALLSLNSKTMEPIVQLLSAVQEVCMVIVGWAMKIVPYAVFGMIAQLVANIGFESLAGIGYYILVVIIGLIILLILNLLVVQFLGGGSSLQFLKKIRDVQLLAFSTTSSAAVMPLSLKTAEEKLGVQNKISNFIIPIGATINMSGTALYQCISTIFIAQAYGIELAIPTLVLMNITIVLASIGTPAIPGGGVIVMASILQSAGIPGEGVVLIIGVERILGMFRTVINVTGDLTACMFFNHKSIKSEINEHTKTDLSTLEIQ